jgi:hypothetical protein
MTLSQSKKMSQLTADNAQWEDRQLLRSGAVRGTEQQTEFDDEDENRVILLVHGKCCPSSSIPVPFCTTTSACTDHWSFVIVEIYCGK